MTEVAPNRYDCQASPGTFASTDVSHYLRGNVIRARIRFTNAQPHPEGLTWGGFHFVLDNNQTASVMVVAPRDNSDRLYVGLKPPGSTTVTVMASMRRSQLVEVGATMARGAIFVRTGEHRGQIYVGDARLVGRTAGCSSGRFDIELVDRIRPPRPY